MYTKDISLVDITEWYARQAKLYKFRQLEQYWGKHRRTSSQDMCSKIVNPISFELNGSVDDYVNAFHSLLQHDIAYKLYVKNPGTGTGWAFVKIYPDEIKNFPKFLAEHGEHIEYMAGIAYNDRKKDNFLRIKFRRWDEKKGEHKGPNAEIEFREHKDKLIGYQGRISFYLEDIFTVSKQRNAKGYNLNHCIWVPDDFESIRDEKPTEGEDHLRWMFRNVE